MSNLDNDAMFEVRDPTMFCPVVTGGKQENFLARNRPLLRKCAYCHSNHHSDANCPNCGAPDTSKLATRHWTHAY